MLALGQLYSSIESDLAECMRIFRDELICDQSFISDLCRHVDQFHGKLLRPAYLLLTAQATGGVRPEHHVLGAVVEMVHIATLVHDDILDEADIRRRAATVNRLWGNESAVLTGDFLFSHAFTLCSSLQSQFASRLIGQTAVTLCEGELMQCSGRGNFDLSEGQYYDIITRKTASLIGACGLLGAKFAGADEGVVRAMKETGIALGIAFQIVDDVLDLTGDEVETGKSLGRDVHKGKLTLPLIRFLSTCPRSQHAQALSLLRGDDPQRYRQVARMLSDSDAIEYANRAATDQVHAALDRLRSLPPSDARASLLAMAEFVLARRA
ncbi:MAG: polyprenyl synthetase family protein [Phycisphaerae bacterium]